ncbi:MAG: hypothetical protein GW903_00380 [Alphaproteobacteria bacterium]|nr:hypothetical protein [Alphaproteobacteria bacterium]NCQ87427.1 hypothetical protein [Alphaproteobacteria bacterium]NCT06298.1 hypothetical protein [Alphaproteobacteria bacterium]
MVSGNAEQEDASLLRNEIYPALAISFSESGTPYRGEGNTKQEARNNALKICHDTNASCLISRSYDAGEPICLSISFAQRPTIYVETQSRPQNGEEHPLQSACQQTRDPANCMRQRATFCNHSP